MASSNTEPVEFDRKPTEQKPRPQPDAIDKFMKELQALSEKHDLYIHGCGCDGSPWLETSDIHYGSVRDNIHTDPKPKVE